MSRTASSANSFAQKGTDKVDKVDFILASLLPRQKRGKFYTENEKLFGGRRMQSRWGWKGSNR